MTRALITQLVDALNKCEAWTNAHDECSEAITAAREYLATEPKDVRQVDTLDVAGERAELIDRQRWVQEHGANPAMRALAKSTADMLEADAHQATPDIKALQAKGKGPAPCAMFCEANAFQIEIRRLTAEINAQQAKLVPMTEQQIMDLRKFSGKGTNIYFDKLAFARAIEAHRGITQADKPTDWSAA